MAARTLSRGWQISVVGACVLAFFGGVFLLSKADRVGAPETINSEFSSQARGAGGVFHPTAAQWAALTVENWAQQRAALIVPRHGVPCPPDS